MQAIGLKLEENGTVLALRDDEHHALGAKWDRVPQSVLQKLESASKVSCLFCPGRQVDGFLSHTLF